jgi:hypothetical protein
MHKQWGSKYMTSSVFKWSIFEKLEHLNSRPFENQPCELDYKESSHFVQMVFCHLKTGPKFEWSTAILSEQLFTIQKPVQNSNGWTIWTGHLNTGPFECGNSICTVFKLFQTLNVSFSNPRFIIYYKILILYCNLLLNKDRRQ